jgi:hypothetical protein
MPRFNFNQNYTAKNVNFNNGKLNVGFSEAPTALEEQQKQATYQGTLLRNQQTAKALKTDPAQEATDKEAMGRARKLQELTKVIDSFAYQIDKIPGGEGLPGRIQGLGNVVSGALQTDPNIAAYSSFMMGLRPVLSRGLGDVGNLSEQEQKAAMSLLPQPMDNLETRAAKLRNFLDFIHVKGLPVDKMNLQFIPKYIEKITGKPYAAPGSGDDPLGVFK